MALALVALLLIASSSSSAQTTPIPPDAAIRQGGGFRAALLRAIDDDGFEPDFERAVDSERDSWLVQMLSQRLGLEVWFAPGSKIGPTEGLCRGDVTDRCEEATQATDCVSGDCMVYPDLVAGVELAVGRDRANLLAGHKRYRKRPGEGEPATNREGGGTWPFLDSYYRLYPNDGDWTSSSPTPGSAAYYWRNQADQGISCNPGIDAAVANRLMYVDDGLLCDFCTWAGPTVDPGCAPDEASIPLPYGDSPTGSISGGFIVDATNLEAMRWMGDHALDYLEANGSPRGLSAIGKWGWMGFSTRDPADGCADEQAEANTRLGWSAVPGDPVFDPSGDCLAGLAPWGPVGYGAGEYEAGSRAYFEHLLEHKPADAVILTSDNPAAYVRASWMPPFLLSHPGYGGQLDDRGGDRNRYVNVAPTLNAGGPYAATVGVPASITASVGSSDQDGPGDTRFAWSFASPGGACTGLSIVDPSDEDVRVSGTPTTAGTCQLDGVARDGLGASSSDSASIVVSP